MLIVWILLGLAALCLLISYICYRIAFYAPPRKPLPEGTIEIPEGEIYEAHREKMENWVRQMWTLPRQSFDITSFDGLKLHAKYYEYAPGAPIELMFHGYRGSAERDLSGGIERCFRVGRSALIVDQRCAGESDGHVITFGIHERRDCLRWIDFTIDHFGPDVKIILTGISMGAATVLMAGAEKLPPNVLGILADCGYSSAKAIMYEVIREMGLPPVLSYPFVRLGANIFGRFDLEETSPLEAVQTARDLFPRRSGRFRPLPYEPRKLRCLRQPQASGNHSRCRPRPCLRGGAGSICAGTLRVLRPGMLLSQIKMTDTLSGVRFLASSQSAVCIEIFIKLIHGLHQLMQESDIMQAQQHRAVHLVDVDKMPQVRLRVIFTAITIAFVVQRREIFLVFPVPHNHSAMGRHRRAVARNSRRQNTVEHIHPAQRSLYQAIGRTHAHQIPGYVVWQ